MGNRKITDFLSRYWFQCLIIIICIVALIVRVKCCFWGFPIHTHPDEFATVDYTIEMLERHSWEAHIYSRPDHFEIKIDSIIFTIVSWLVYRKPAYEAYKEHEMTFYLLARGFTTIFGVGIIPLACFVCGQLFDYLKKSYRRLLQIFVSLLLCFSYTFVQHSAYATPDVILTFFILLFTLFITKYLGNGKNGYFIGGLLSIAIGFTIKYPAAIMSISFATAVIYRKVHVEKKPKDIWKCILLSFAIILITIFVISPNLITNLGTVIDNVILESGSERFLGVDGLSFWGNLCFYLNFIFSEFGYETIIPFFIGLGLIIKEHKIKSLSLINGIIFLICLSLISIHWTRWMIPVLPFYLIVFAFGLIEMVRFVYDKLMVINKHLYLLFNIMLGVFGFLVIVNSFISCLAVVKFSSLPDMILYAEEFCNGNGINEKNSIYDGRTPMSRDGSYRNIREFTFVNDEVVPIVSKGSKEYYVMCDSWRNLFFQESSRYVEECKLYDAIDEKYELIFHCEPDGNYGKGAHILENMMDSIGYLNRECSYTGYPISIYSLKPKFFAIVSSDGKYLSPVEEISDTPIRLNDEIYYWTKYDNGDGTYNILSKTAEFSLGVKPSVERFALFIPENNDYQRCTIVDLEEGNKISFANNGEILSANGNRVEICKGYSEDKQLWTFVPYDE